MGLGGQGLDPNLRRFVMPKWLLRELTKTSPNKSCKPFDAPQHTQTIYVHQGLGTPKLSNKALVIAGLAVNGFVRFSFHHSHMHPGTLHAIMSAGWAQVRKTALCELERTWL